MVLKEIGKAEPHQNVAAWLGTIDDGDLAICALTVREIWKGIERKRESRPELAAILEISARRVLCVFDGGGECVPLLL